VKQRQEKRESSETNDDMVAQFAINGSGRAKAHKRKVRDKVGLDCLLSTGPGKGVYIRACETSMLRVRREGGRVKMSAKANAVMSADGSVTMARSAVSEKKKKLLKSIQMRDGGCMVEGEVSAATFDGRGQGTRGNAGIENGRSSTRRNIRERTKRGSSSPSRQTNSPNLRGVVYEGCNVKRRAFLCGARLSRWSTTLGRSSCLRP